MRSKLFVFTASLFLLSTLASAQEIKSPSKGLALTPPMGWNTWNKFGCNVSEELVRGAADAMVSSGMKAAGYQYIVIDDCWQEKRDDKANIVPYADRFPNGMKAVADYVHSKGLKFGIYSDAGTKTSGGKPGGLGHEFQGAVTYSRYRVGLFKV